MKKSFIQSLVLAGVAIALAIPAHADLVNGTFSTPPPGQFDANVTGTTIPGWTVTSGNVDWINTYWQQPPGGGFSLDMDGSTPGAISQTVATTAGVTYDLTFELSGNHNNEADPDKILNVSAGPSSQQFTYNVDTFNNNNTTMLWQSESFIFTASGPSTSITFASGDTPGNLTGPALGDVSLNVVTTPEPGLYGALAIGLSGLFYVMFRRRRA
jgi:choice-of-anchor C domain-containing protein